MPSIRLRLLKWLIGPILLLNLAGGALTYVLAWMPAQIAFDQSLSDAAGALAARFTVRDAAGALIAGDADFAAPRHPLRALAPLAYDAALRGEPVRSVALRYDADGRSAYIAVAKTLRKRVQIRGAIFRALVPLEALFTLASVGLIWFSVTNGLLPLNRMRADLNARGGDELAHQRHRRAVRTQSRRARLQRPA